MKIQEKDISKANKNNLQYEYPIFFFFLLSEDLESKLLKFKLTALFWVYKNKKKKGLHIN